jgi:hypothetical protein
MATASRTRPPVGAKQRPRTRAIGALAAIDALRTWAIPVAAGVAIVVCAALAAAGVLRTDLGLALIAGAALVLLAYIGLRPLVESHPPPAGWPLGAALGVIWLAVCYVPFHARLFPGTPLVDAAQITAAGAGLPLRIPAAGHGQIDLLLEGKLAAPTTGGVAPPVHFTLTMEGADATPPRVIDGRFEDTLRTQRLGRRGTAVVHQTHTADVRVIPNPGRSDLQITRLSLEPESTQAITVTAYAHPLPGPIVLALVTIALLGAVVAFDRLGPAPETDGALTLATAAVVGTAVIFWTSNAIHPTVSTLIGSAIFGGPLGFAAGALVWWVAKQLIVRPAR